VGQLDTWLKTNANTQGRDENHVFGHRTCWRSSRRRFPDDVLRTDQKPMTTFIYEAMTSFYARSSLLCRTRRRGQNRRAGAHHKRSARSGKDAHQHQKKLAGQIDISNACKVRRLPHEGRDARELYTSRAIRRSVLQAGRDASSGDLPVRGKIFICLKRGRQDL
jgi:hypothetical protein